MFFKKFVTVTFLSLTVVGHAAENEQLLSYTSPSDFSAPVVGNRKVLVEVPVGTIVFDSSDDNLYARNITSDATIDAGWFNLSASSRPASATDSGYVTTGAQTFGGIKSFANHLKSIQTVAPGSTPGANAGSGATCNLSNATDVAGNISIITGTGATAGFECVITFNSAYSTAPICTLTPTNPNAAQSFGSPYVTTSTTLLNVKAASTPASSTTYTFAYSCIETQ